MITVKALYRTLEEMRSIYPFEDDKTAFNLERSAYTMSNSDVVIQTRDKKTDIHICLTKNAAGKEGVPSGSATTNG